MRRSNAQQFLRGLTAGAFGSFIGAAVVLYVLARLHIISFPDEQTPDPGRWLEWAHANLGSSIPVFALLLLAWWISLARLRRHLESYAPINEVAQLDHLTDIWTTLFVGTGVIWTAIGMRGALLFSLGDPQSVTSDGAFAILQRMVDGGVLVALSTTIFGGIGGYLMRVYKSVTLGALLQRRYDLAARADTSRIRDTLERIENHLKAAGRSAGEPAAARDDPGRDGT
jgi:hypothetical protein